MCKVKLLLLFLIGVVMSVDVDNISDEGSQLNMGEILSIQYNLIVGKEPLEEHEEFDQDYVIMRDVHGVKYGCQLPFDTREEPDNDEGLSLTSEQDITQLLSHLEAGPCLRGLKDFWTYEICVQKYVLQYHVENDIVQDSQVILGSYEQTVDYDGTRFVSQTYSNGTMCDLTGNNRQAEVRFSCMKEETMQDSIVAVDEVSPCVYTLSVHVASLCQVDSLRQSPRKTKKNISCNRLLSKDQMTQFRKEQALRERQKYYLVSTVSGDQYIIHSSQVNQGQSGVTSIDLGTSKSKVDMDQGLLEIQKLTVKTNQILEEKRRLTAEFAENGELLQSVETTMKLLLKKIEMSRAGTMRDQLLAQFNMQKTNSDQLVNTLQILSEAIEALQGKISAGKSRITELWNQRNQKHSNLFSSSASEENDNVIGENSKIVTLKVDNFKASDQSIKQDAKIIKKVDYNSPKVKHDKKPYLISGYTSVTKKKRK